MVAALPSKQRTEARSVGSWLPTAVTAPLNTPFMRLCISQRLPTRLTDFLVPNAGTILHATKGAHRRALEITELGQVLRFLQHTCGGTRKRKFYPQTLQCWRLCAAKRRCAAGNWYCYSRMTVLRMIGANSKQNNVIRRRCEESRYRRYGEEVRIVTVRASGGLAAGSPLLSDAVT